MKQTVIALIALLVGSLSAPAAERSTSPPVVYYANDRAAAPGDESKALAAYRQYNVVTPGKKDRFTPPRVSTRTYPRTAPGGKVLPNGKVRFAAIVTAEGRVTKPILLDASDDYLGFSVIGVVRAWRCKSALLNGVPVAAVMIYALDVRPGDDHSRRHDSGLGYFPNSTR